MLISGTLTKFHIIGEFHFSRQCAPVYLDVSWRTWFERPDRLFRIAGSRSAQNREDILEGIEHVPGSIAGLYRSENFGKRLIRIAPQK